MTTPRRALVVVDVQQEYFEGLLPIQYPTREQSVRRIREAINAAAHADTPIVIVQHELPAGAPVFGSGSVTIQNHPDIAGYEGKAAKRVSKQFGSIFAGTELDAWLRDQGIDTITLVGYMTNNCILSSAADAEPRGFNVEVLSDATGAIDLANEAGTASAQQVHETLMVLLHSNWAAVVNTNTWIAALQANEPLDKSNLVISAAQGRDVMAGG
jgi:nicotinamidase-related amidase